MRKTLEERIKKQGTCLVWIGSKKVSGYGELRQGKKKVQAHRFIYELKNGKIPEGKIIMHTCDNPSCVNLKHLRCATQLDNMRDKLNKGRGNNPRGKNHPFAKDPSKAPRGEAKQKSILTEQNVRDIRIKYAQSSVTQKQLAELYKIDQSAVSCIISKKTWAHVS